jgi:hypothetical protein
MYDEICYISDEKDYFPLIENIFELYDEEEIEQNDELRVLVDYLEDKDKDTDSDDDEIDVSSLSISNQPADSKSIDSLLATVRRELEVPLIPDLANICMEYYSNYDDIKDNIMQLCEKRDSDMKKQEVCDDFERKDRERKKRYRCEDVEEINKSKQARRDNGEDSVSDDEVDNSTDDELRTIYSGYDTDDLEVVHEQIDPSLAISRDYIVGLINDITNKWISEESVDMIHVAAESYLIDMFKKANELYDGNIPDGKFTIVAKHVFQTWKKLWLME